MLEVKNVSKEFPGVKALDNVSMSFERGSIHALMGENGAGKSTLMKVITGIYVPELGDIYIDGQHVAFKSYQDSIDHNISMVHQEIQVIPHGTVGENIVLDKLSRFSKFGCLDWKKINETAKKYLDMVELNVKPTDVIANMTAAQKQLIQIAKALSSDAQFILLDEPTSSLTMYETKNLFAILRKLRDDGKSLIFVSHKIEEVTSLCDRVTVLRDGKVTGSSAIKDITRHDLIRMMIGRDENIDNLGQLDISDEVVLEARGIGKAGMFEDVNFKAYKGEILGFYGLVGAGRTELARLLIGADKMDTGEVFINGKLAHIHNVADSVYKYGLSYISENRKEEGLILSFSVRDNIILTNLPKMRGKMGKLNQRIGEEMTRAMIEKMEIKTPSQETVIESLSGGNQQKVSLGKSLLTGSNILIIDEPTVGVDVGVKRHIHEIIWQLAKEEGKTIILISSDMAEMIALARRILVFRDYKIVAEINELNDMEHSYNEVSARIGNAIS
ncbi:MAG: sugar ABC transporter ATP-binding protein [Clostridia bacterium]